MHCHRFMSLNDTKDRLIGLQFCKHFLAITVQSTVNRLTVTSLVMHQFEFVELDCITVTFRYPLSYRGAWTLLWHRSSSLTTLPRLPYLCLLNHEEVSTVFTTMAFLFRWLVSTGGIFYPVPHAITC